MDTNKEKETEGQNKETSEAVTEETKENTAQEAVRQEEQEKKKKSIIHEMVGTVVYFAAIFLAVFLVVNYVGQRTEVNGDSMLNTLESGDNLIIDKISYRFSDPQRFDIVVFPCVNDNYTDYIKRIIGLPGETIWIDGEGQIYIDGEVIDDPYGREVIWTENRGRASEPITLGENEYFVMGDNRNMSQDSRSEIVGNVDGDLFLGKVWIRIWPLDKFGSVD
jgi:signal peptidase I